MNRNVRAPASTWASRASSASNRPHRAGSWTEPFASQRSLSVTAGLRQQPGKAVQFPRQRDRDKFNKRLDAGLSLQVGAELIGHFYVNVAHTMAFASSSAATTTCWVSEAPECSAGAHTLKARPDSVRDALAYRVRRTVRSCGVMSCRKLGCFGPQSRRRLRVCQSL